MKIYKLNPTYQFGSNCYVIENGNERAMIDPSTNPHLSKYENLKLKYIILTHTHFDHMLFIDEWLEKSGAELIVGENDALGLTDSTVNCYKFFFNREKNYCGKYKTVKEGDTLSLGDKQLKFIDVPGHTSGSIAVIADESVFVGDVVFSKGVYGRTDLPGGNYETLSQSVKKISNLPKNFIIYPGHGQPTTIGEI